VKPLSQATCLGVDYPGRWWSGSLIDKLAFTRTNLSGVRVIMTIMCVPVGQFLCQAMMGHIPVLEYPLPATRGLLWCRLDIAGIKCCRYLRTRRQWRLPDSGEPPSMATGDQGPCRIGA
jgi:hypothetical protein